MSRQNRDKKNAGTTHELLKKLPDRFAAFFFNLSFGSFIPITGTMGRAYMHQADRIRNPLNLHRQQMTGVSGYGHQRASGQKVLKKFIVGPEKKIRLKNFETGWVQHESFRNKPEEVVDDLLKEVLEKDQKELLCSTGAPCRIPQDGILIVLQGMDTAGKDGTIRHVMSGVNPQGCDVHSFKVPDVEDHLHDFLWRYERALPERGMIGIFNRSYYEDVLVVHVHPERMEELPGNDRPGCGRVLGRPLQGYQRL